MTKMIQLVLETKDISSLPTFLKEMEDEFLKQRVVTVTSASIFNKTGKKMMTQEKDDE